MRSMVVRLCAVALVSFLLVAPCLAIEGSANGDLTILYTDHFARGYSTNTLSWSTILLSGQPIRHGTSANLGLVITTERLYVYNPLTGQWFSRTYVGDVERVDMDGPVAVLCTDQACYGISSIWNNWAVEDLRPGERVLGAGSCCTFGIVWTNQRGIAYRGNQNAWAGVDLGSAPLGGMAEQGLGLVYCAHEVQVYDPSAGGWIACSFSDALNGLSASGSGKVALIWNKTQAYAYSGHLQTWTSHEEEILDGSAGGNVALGFNNKWAFAFDAITGEWVSLFIEDQGGMRGGGTLAAFAPQNDFALQGNPSTGNSLQMSLPSEQGNPWKIEVLDITGRRIHSSEIPASSQGSVFEFSWTDDSGRPVPAGNYWVRAHSDSHEEVRRIVRLK